MLCKHQNYKIRDYRRQTKVTRHPVRFIKTKTPTKKVRLDIQSWKLIFQTNKKRYRQIRTKRAQHPGYKRKLSTAADKGSKRGHKVAITADDIRLFGEFWKAWKEDGEEFGQLNSEQFWFVKELNRFAYC